MNILVCVSRVPDTASKIVIGNDRKSINDSGIKYIINPYDEFAIEEALLLKAKNGGTVTAVTVGAEASQDILRTAIAMGVDEATIIIKEGNFDSFFTAYNIAEYAKTLNPDLILLGRQSIDFDSFQTPSALAEMLDMPAVSVVAKLNVEGGKLTAERDIEGGKEILEAELPCIISTQKGLNNPRYPKLPDIMKAKKKTINIIPSKEIEVRTEIIDIQLPSKQRAGKILTDSDADIAEFVRLLKEEAKVI